MVARPIETAGTAKPTDIAEALAHPPWKFVLVLMKQASVETLFSWRNHIVVTSNMHESIVAKSKLKL